MTKHMFWRGCAAVMVALGMVSLVQASGGYGGASSGYQHQRDTTYQLGKSLFNGRKNVNGLESCKDCHRGKQLLDRVRLKPYRDRLTDLLNHCPGEPNCLGNALTPSQQRALLHYLNERYRL